VIDFLTIYVAGVVALKAPPASPESAADRD
jgi:hypothetical protein